MFDFEQVKKQISDEMLKAAQLPSHLLIPEEFFLKIEMNKITQQYINVLLDLAETQEHIFWDKELVVSYKLPNGFTICGRGACVDPANFDIEIGRKVAREDVENQLWKLEGYLLQQRLHEEGKL